MPFHAIASLLLFFCGALFVLIDLPLLFDLVPMNRWYGVRIPKSYSSDENWYKLNRFGAKCLIGWSVVPIGAGVANLIVPFVTEDRAWLVAVIVMVPVLAALAQILVYARKL